MTTRYAVYFVPGATDPLCQRGQAWLGRDVLRGVDLDPPRVPAVDDGTLADLLASPRRYGFHATLKAPFRLAEGMSEGDLTDAFETYCAGRGPAPLPGLRVGDLGGFIALLLRQPSPAVTGLADDVVRAFDVFRAPLSDAERARRRPERLTPAQRDSLDRWGYPWVGDDFTFHMTLTARVTDTALRQRLHGHLDRLMGAPARALTRIGHLALLRQDGPEAPFRAMCHRPLGGAGGA